MGKTLLDEYSLLHFSVGVIAKQWSMDFWIFFILHTLFEFLENTKTGMWLINNYFTMWPGGKNYADSIINRVGDTISAAAGWLAADALLRLRPSL